MPVSSYPTATQTLALLKAGRLRSETLMQEALSCIQSIIGDEIVGSSVYRNRPKLPGHSHGEVPWHQDYNYWPIDPLINISAWVAVDAVTIENSGVQIIPGSQKKILRHVSAPHGMDFQDMADPEAFDTGAAVSMELKPGEFFLFSERTLHRSAPNTSGKRRIGLAIRVTIPIVNVEHEKLFKDHACILLRGEDRMGFNRLTDLPE